MKKVISIFALMCILCTSIIFPVKASNVEALAVEEYATDIYQQMLVDSGLAEQKSDIIIKSRSSNMLDVATYTVDSLNQKVNNTIAYIEEDGKLVDAYSAIYRSVATGKVEELSNTKIMGFNITVNYDYYEMSYNDYVDPHYQHGTLEITASTNPMITSIGNFECVYVSRGTETNSDGSWTGDFITCTSRVIRTYLKKGDYIYVGAGNYGNPYLWKFSSTVENGMAFSGVAYSFTFGGRTYSDKLVILYDTTESLPDYDELDWGI